MSGEVYPPLLAVSLPDEGNAKTLFYIHDKTTFYFHEFHLKMFRTLSEMCVWNENQFDLQAIAHELQWSNNIMCP